MNPCRPSLPRSSFLLLYALCIAFAQAQQPATPATDFATRAEKAREAMLQSESPLPPKNLKSRAPQSTWKQDIITTVFSIGDRNRHHPASAWDEKWELHYGGYDNPDPTARRNFIPTAFTPRLNPFYVALPYNDVAAGQTQPEARLVIPWFKNAFVREGISVCQDRWVAIRSRVGNRVAYAQWCDCGPFRSDHYQYVFGNERPKPNANQGTGLNVSPAVRDYLGLSTTDTTDWKFCEVREVPPGPWAQYGTNNPLAGKSKSE
jgi:hypothetical protein